MYLNKKKKKKKKKKNSTKIKILKTKKIKKNIFN